MSIRARMKQLIAAKTRDRTRYVELKELTGISGDIWKNFWFGRREPDAVMVETLGRAWPDHAFWLTTGATNFTAGHICPDNAERFELGAAAPSSAKTYLESCVEAVRWLEAGLKDASPEEIDQVHAVLKQFVGGSSVHVMPERHHLIVDRMFKLIRKMNQANALLKHELGQLADDH